MGVFAIDLSDDSQTGGGWWLRGQARRYRRARRLMTKLGVTLDQALILVDA